MRNLFTKFAWAALFSLCLCIFPISALADGTDFPLPASDVAELLLKLATNYKSMGVLGILSVATLLSVQAIKAFAPEGWKFKRLITLAVSIAYSIIAGVMIPGSNIASVVVTIFITSGGAVALYEAAKGAGLIKSQPKAAG